MGLISRCEGWALGVEAWGFIFPELLRVFKVMNKTLINEVFMVAQICLAGFSEMVIVH